MKREPTQGVKDSWTDGVAQGLKWNGRPSSQSEQLAWKTRHTHMASRPPGMSAGEYWEQWDELDNYWALPLCQAHYLIEASQ